MICANARTPRFFSLLLLLALGACAGGGMGAASGYTTTLGTFEPEVVSEQTRDYLRRVAWEIELENGPPAILIQTFWKTQLPTDAEAAEGVVEARTRFRVLGRQRQGMTEVSQVYVTQLVLEHQVRTETNGLWVERPAASDFVDWARTTAREMQLQMESARGRTP